MRAFVSQGVEDWWWDWLGEGQRGGPCSLHVLLDGSVHPVQEWSPTVAGLSASVPDSISLAHPQSTYPIQFNFSLPSVALIGIQHCPLPMLGTCSHSHCLHCMVQQILPPSLCSCCSLPPAQHDPLQHPGCFGLNAFFLGQTRGMWESSLSRSAGLPGLCGSLGFCPCPAGTSWVTLGLSEPWALYL